MHEESIAGRLVEFVDRSGRGMEGLRAACHAEDPTGELWNSAWEVLYGPDAGLQEPSAALRMRILKVCGYGTAQWPDLFSSRSFMLPDTLERPPQHGAELTQTGEGVPPIPRRASRRAALIDPREADDAAELTALMSRLMSLYGASYRELERSARVLGYELRRSTLNDLLRAGRLPSHDQLEAFLRAVGFAMYECESWLAVRDQIALASAADFPIEPEPAAELEVGQDMPTGSGTRKRTWWTPFRSGR